MYNRTLAARMERGKLISAGTWVKKKYLNISEMKYLMSLKNHRYRF